MQTKMASSSHTPWNTEENRDPNSIVGRVRHGVDIFNREDQIYDRIEDPKDVPKYVLENGERFGHMLYRDGEDAGFWDFDWKSP